MSFIQTSRNSVLHSLKRTELCTRLRLLKVYKFVPASQATCALLLFWVHINDVNREHCASVTPSCQYLSRVVSRIAVQSGLVMYVDPEDVEEHPKLWPGG